MFRQVKGEGLNVGCVLTWGPGFDYQQQFFAPAADKRSEPLTLMKYDIEISGFGSEALGHVCPAQPEGSDLSGCDRKQGLADVDASGAALGKGAGRCRWVRPLRQRTPGRSGGRDQASGRPARHERGRQARRRRGHARSSAGAVCRDRHGSRRLPRGGRVEGEPRSCGRSAAESRHPRDQWRRGAGDLRHGGAGACDFISAMDTVASGNGTRGIT